MKLPDVRKMFPYQMRLRVYTRTDMAAMGEAVLDAVEADPEFAPQKYGRYEPFKTTPADARRLWQEEAAKPFGVLGGQRRRPFYVGFDAKFGDALQGLKEMVDDGLVDVSDDRIGITETGPLFVRNAAMHFDAYLQPPQSGDRPLYSRTV